MKKNFLIGVCMCLLKTIYGQTNDTVFISFYDLDIKYKDEMYQALVHLLIKVIKDTLNFDSLKIYYYPNGKIYKIMPFVNGKVNGIKEMYYSNGQLHSKVFIKEGKTFNHNSLTNHYAKNYRIDGFKVFNSYFVIYDFNGNIESISYDGRYRLKNIELTFTYFNNERKSLYMHTKKKHYQKEFYWNTFKRKWIGKTCCFKKRHSDVSIYIDFGDGTVFVNR